jgi:hypothetical protein
MERPLMPKVTDRNHITHANAEPISWPGQVQQRTCPTCPAAMETHDGIWSTCRHCGTAVMARLVGFFVVNGDAP